jgi:hypothetical protein
MGSRCGKLSPECSLPRSRYGALSRFLLLYSTGYLDATISFDAGWDCFCRSIAIPTQTADMLNSKEPKSETLGIMNCGINKMPDIKKIQPGTRENALVLTIALPVNRQAHPYA